MKKITPEMITQKIEEIAQDFKRKLHLTGGNLALPKCFWYLVNWVWDDHGNPKMSTISQSPATISLIQGTFTQKYLIKREEPSTSIRTIGVRVNPLGTTEAEYFYRLHFSELSINYT